MSLPKDFGLPFTLNSILQNNVPDKHLVPDKLLKWANIFDICHRDSRRSCCFTKSYTHYVDGTGSIFTEANPEDLKKCLEKANFFEVGSEDFKAIVKGLKLRYFTPQEVLSLMMFPETYSFPASITTKQCYRLLGNSVNVQVISELLKILFDNK